MYVSDFLETPYGQRLAYQRWVGDSTKPGMLFLGGFRSDMLGTKAQFLMKLAQIRNQSCLIFDYTGHGQSSGVFEDGILSDWLKDAAYVLEEATAGPQILVGSSMGGWLAFILAQQFSHRLRCLIGIACAPDFTQELLEKKLTDQERSVLNQEGKVEIRSGPFSHPVSKTLIEDGQKHLLLSKKFEFPFPIHLFHGTDDEEVPYLYSQRLMAQTTCPFGAVHFIQGGDHRLNQPDHLAFIGALIPE